MRTSPILILLSAGLASAAAAQSAPAVPPPPSSPIMTVPMLAPPPPAPPPLLRSRPSQPVPRGHMGQWITMKDYPTDARKRREEGATKFVLTVAANGQPSACEVVVSSGSPRLDLATCRLAQQRARFDPAIDGDGKAEVGYYPGVVVWRLDRSRDAPLPGTVTHTFMVELDGTVTNCRIASVIGDAKKQYRVGPETCRLSRIERGFEAVEGRKRKRVTEVETIVVSEVPVAPAMP